jgi:alkanesulfonate monooxygenase SsuD/methylene tetrahydromethanopterin reductase-like flavin-dependent oxidoreductase (luciferase family)
MLAITAPHMRLWNAWYTSFENRPDKLAPLLARLDAAARAAGRDAREIERTVAVLVQLDGGRGREHGDEEGIGALPLRGSPEAVAEELLRYAAIGIDAIQLVLDPITLGSIEWCGKMLESLRTR